MAIAVTQETKLGARGLPLKIEPQILTRLSSWQEPQLGVGALPKFGK
jgi:hypothetical protein